MKAALFALAVLLAATAAADATGISYTVKIEFNAFEHGRNNAGDNIRPGPFTGYVRVNVAAVRGVGAWNTTLTCPAPVAWHGEGETGSRSGLAAAATAKIGISVPTIRNDGFVGETWRCWLHVRALDVDLEDARRDVLLPVEVTHRRRFDGH